jgi:transposase InsO family protein
MPFRGVSAMKEEFCRLALKPDANIRQLCRGFGVSPTTGYKLLARFQVAGSAGLEERSRRPHGSPVRTASAIEAEVLAVRTEHPTWGGRKIARVLRNAGLAAPAPSTITAILRRHDVPLGLAGGPSRAWQRFTHAQPNDLWQMDFKGHFAMRRGRCHPLTVVDDHSRYAVVLAACTEETTQTVQAALCKAFQRVGKPWRILTDNGAPWGDDAETRLTRLGVWLIEHDIGILHTSPGHPQTNGKDERFNRTLAAELLAFRNFDDLTDAQEAFDRWRQVYNTKRPHDALGLDVPADRYVASSRTFSEQVAPFPYGPDDTVCGVNSERWIRFQGRGVRVSRALAGKEVAVRPTTEDGVYDIMFRSYRVKSIDRRGPDA